MSMRTSPDAEASLDFCQGCFNERRNPLRYTSWLPLDWKEGDPIPDKVTRHGTPRERAEGKAPFVFKHRREGRVLVDG